MDRPRPHPRLLRAIQTYANPNNPQGIAARVAALTTALDDETINPNEANKAGWTALFYAANREPLNFELLDTLVNHPRVDVGHQDAEGQTVLHNAAAEGHCGVVERLLQWHDARRKLVEVGDKTGRTPLSWAAGNGRTDVIRHIVEAYPHSCHQGDDNGREPLPYSTRKGPAEAVSFLIGKAGDSVGSTDNDGRTALSFAAGAPVPPDLFGRGNRSTTEVIELLNEDSPDLINAPDSGGGTPLWWAVKGGNTAAVETLLRLQPTLNVLEEGGVNDVSSLQLALQSRSASICRPLLKKVPRPQAHNIVRLLQPEAMVSFAHCLRPHRYRGVGPLAKGDPLEERDDDGRTALHEAVRVNSATVLSELLDLEADINATDINGWTPLHEAAALGAVGPVQTLLEPNRNADIDARDSSKMTPLRVALENRRDSVIDLLLGHSATLDDLTAKNWRDSCHRSQHSRNILELSEAPDVASRGMKRIRRARRLIPEPDLLDGLPNEGEKKLFFALDENVPWTEILGRIVGREQDRRSFVRVGPAAAGCCFDYNIQEQEQAFMTRVIVKARLPHNESSEASPLDMKLHNWRLCEAVWEVGTRHDSTAPGIQFFSMLPHGRVPSNEFDFMRLLFEHSKAEWLRACEAVEAHLVSKSDFQLRRRGETLVYLDHLASDASSVALLKRRSREYVDGGRVLVDYSRSHSTRSSPQKDIQEAVKAIDRFSNEVSEKLSTLDQTVRNILHLEFTWVSVKEAHRSASLAESMNRLSWITFIFLPAIFASSLFGMNVNLLEDNPDWRWYLAFAGGFLILTLVGWIGSKLYQKEGFGRHLKDMAAKVQDRFRAKSPASPDMTNDNRSPRRSIGSV